MSTKQLALSVWGVVGVVALIGRGLYMLTPIALEPIRAQLLDGWHWVILVGWSALNAYTEGYRGFHRSFSPRVVERSFDIGREPTLARVALAPAYCMGLFHAPRRTLIASWSLLIGIVLLVVLIRHLAQPWRGIVDAGVVVGLGAGLASLLFLYARALHARRQRSGSG